MITILRFLPKNLLSWLAGVVAALKLPGAINTRLISSFAEFYGVNLTEAEHPANAYASLGDFFVRDLKPGSRPIGDQIVSPADGVITENGFITGGQLLQVKGREYSFAELIGSGKNQPLFEGGSYATIYLSPPDYHHVHSPISGTLTNYRYIPGTLWPVNESSVRVIPKLFCVNERVVTEIETSIGTVLVVLVGATNVGSIRMTHAPIVTNQLRAFWRERKVAEILPNTPVVVSKGERVGTFYLGSTVIVLFPKGAVELNSDLRGKRVKMGENIATLRKA